MKKINIEVPETKKEAIDLFVKSAVSSDDIDLWLINSKKGTIMKKLKMIKELANDNGIQLLALQSSDFEDICNQVEKQILELIVGFDE